jgi:TonB family protein
MSAHVAPLLCLVLAACEQAAAAPPGPTGSSTTPNDIDRKIKQQVVVFKACYQREIAKGRDIGGKVILRFTISETGAVSKATASGMDRAVEDCLVAAVKRIVFAPPPDGKPAHVSYPLLFNNP